MAPRHPPRALCSLTSLNNQPKGLAQQTASAVALRVCCAATFQPPLNAVADTSPCEGLIGIFNLCRYSRQKLKIIHSLITSSLVKVPGRPCDLPVFQRSAGRWPRRSWRASSPLINGSVVVDTQRRLEDARAARRLPVFLRGCRGLPDIQFDFLGCSAQFSAPLRLPVPLAPTVKMVETRRLELLTLSLQRRCSSS